MKDALQRGIAIKKYARPIISTITTNIHLEEVALNYELKSIHFSMLTSYRIPNDDLVTYIREFYSIIETFPLNGLNEG